MPPEPEVFCKTILAGTIAKTLLTEVKTGLEKLGTKPHLCGILDNDDPAALVYADWTGKTCKEK
jgi:methylenetetrahydrofolate dehydrogenase (NAD+)